jgi:DNA polymerase III subunit chi
VAQDKADVKKGIDFYHLTRDPLEIGVAKLLAVVYAKGNRTLVRAASKTMVDKLDVALWTFEKDSFLPHGTTRNGQADLQPILLTTDAVETNGANVLMLLENVLPEDVSGFERVLYMFEGRDEAALSQARAHWVQLKADGKPLTYWQQSDSGGWKKAAEG